MDLHRAFHRRLFNKRQGFPFGGLFPGGSIPSTADQGTTSSATSQSSGDSMSLGGILGGFTSYVGGITTPIPSSAPSSTTTSHIPLMPSSSGSTGSTTSAASSPSTSTSSASPASTTSPPTPTSSVSDVVYTTSDGTRIVYITSTPPAASATATSTQPFLRNPSLEGGVFAIVGLLVLILIFTLITCTLRKRRRDRLERDLAAAVTFDPGATDFYERQENSIEKHRLSGSSSGHGHGHDHGYGVPQLAYVPRQEYRGPQVHGQYPAPTRRAPSPNPYQAPPYASPQPAGQGGANLTRKFSDRKPVPPFLPGNPASAYVSVPRPVHYQ